MPEITIADKLKIARQKIDEARRISEIDDVTLVVVTKTRTPSDIADLIVAGCRDIGENRVQEWETKHPLVDEELKKRGIVGKITRHLIGHLQSNKARRAIL